MDFQQLHAVWDNSLSPMHQFLTIREKIIWTHVCKLSLQDIQTFLGKFNKQPIIINNKNIDLIINSCVFITKDIHTYKPTSSLVLKPIKFNPTCGGYYVYCWVIEGAQMLTTGGKRRPYPKMFRYNLCTDGLIPTIINRIIRYKVA